MKFEIKEIKLKIKKLPKLKFENFQVTHTSLTQKPMPTKVSNNDILRELDLIYTEFKNLVSSREQFTVAKPDQDKHQPSRVLKNIRDNFYKTTVGSLDFNSSSTFFSGRFQKQIPLIIKGRLHQNLSKKEILQIDNDLQNTSTVEFEWKEYNQRAAEKATVPAQFQKDYDSFDIYFKALNHPSDFDLSTQRAYRNYLPFKVGRFGHLLINYLYYKLKFKPLEFCVGYSENTLGEIISANIKSHRIFNDLARISIKRAHEKLLNLRDTSHYKEDVLSIERTELVEDFFKSFTVELLYAIINYGENNNLIDRKVAATISRDIQIAIYYRSLISNLYAINPKICNLYYDLLRNILDAFTRTDFFSSRTNETSTDRSGKPCTITTLVLADKLIVNVMRPFKFPNVTKPKSLKKTDVDPLIKQLIHGRGTVTKSNSLVKALNLSMQKPHKVNELLLGMCHKFFEQKSVPTQQSNCLSNWLKEGSIDLGTIHISDLISRKNKLQLFKVQNKTSNPGLRIASEIILQLSKTYNIAMDYSYVLPLVGVTKVEAYRYYAINQLEKDYFARIIEFKYTQSRLYLANQLRTFPMFIKDTLCIRLRKYPREHWLARTAGELKHISENFKPRKLTLHGYHNLLLAYYQADQGKLNKFEQTVSKDKLSKKTGMKTMSCFFKQNPINFTNVKKPMYFLNLHLALLQICDNNYVTAVNVEVDQNASAMVILSLILRSKRMAETCNVLGGIKMSPYDYVKSRVKQFLNSNPKIFKSTGNQDVIEFLCESRKLHKYALMCFCYNQTAKGRMDAFAEEWYLKFNYSPNGRQRNFLNMFANKYADFVEYIYPKTQRKLAILKKIVDLVCNEAPHIQMKTMNGETINWMFFKTDVSKRAYWDPTVKEHKSHHARNPLMREINSRSENKPNEIPENEPEKLQETHEFLPDKKGMKIKFLSYLIHSIDASILRRIMNQLKSEHNVTINHLHDCVILHPNDLDCLYQVIGDIYSKPEVYNLIETGVFTPIRSTLSPESQIKLDGLKNEYFKISDQFEDLLASVVPHHMYSLED